MFLTGEFSKIAQVSKRLLQYYDEIGLFKPEHVEPATGYRYYSAQQLPQLNQILALKELGLTLEQIARMLKTGISPAELRGMLALKKAQMEQRLNEELLRLRYIESRIQQIDTEGVLRNYDVVLKTIEPLRMLSVRQTFSEMNKARPIMIEMLEHLPAIVGKSQLQNLLVIHHSVAYDPESLDLEIGFALRGSGKQKSVQLPSGLTLSARELQGEQQVATVARHGCATLGSGCYNALGQWMEGNGYSTAGAGRELFLKIEPNKDDEMITEIQLPVQKI